MIRLYLPVLAAALGLPATLSAQADWRLTLDLGATRFSAQVHDSSSTDRVFVRPWRPTMYTARVTRETGRLGLGLGLGYAKAPVAGNIDDFVLMLGDEERLIEIAPELRYLVGTTTSGAALRLHFGPVLDIWTPDGAETRSAWGALGGASLELPLAGAWGVEIRADLAVTQSNITDEETSAEIIREPTLRRGRLALGVTRRL